MTIAFLATGDEIVNGDTLNTNTQYMAHALSSDNFTIGLHASCGDEERSIYHCMEFLAHTHDILIIVGGLGPTSDDKTRFALGQFLNTSLIEFPQAIDHISQRLTHAGLQLNERNRQQALFPKKATLLPNPNGTAMGCVCNYQGKVFILLPGPPKECLPMFDNHVLPLLQKTQKSDQQLLRWRLFGVPEGEIAQQLDHALQAIPCVTGYRYDPPYVEFKVRIASEFAAEAQRIIDPLAAPYIIAPVEKKASQLLLENIVEHQQLIIIHDELTGGLLQTLLDHPKSHHFILFRQSPMENMPYFHLSGLNEYWSEQPPSGKNTSLVMDGHVNGQPFHDTYALPYRTALVIQLATEWMCSRILRRLQWQKGESS